MSLEQAERIPSPEMEVTGEELVKVMQSVPFKARLQEGREGVSALDREFKGDLLVMVNFGIRDKLSDGSYTHLFDPNPDKFENWLQKDYLPVMLVRFDNNMRRDELPPYAVDLQSMINLREHVESRYNLSGTPLMILSNYSARNNHIKWNLRVMQETSDSDHDFAKIEGDIELCKSEEEVSESLEWFRYKTEVLDYDGDWPPDNSDGLDETSSEKLGKFSFEIIRIGD